MTHGGTGRSQWIQITLAASYGSSTRETRALGMLSAAPRTGGAASCVMRKAQWPRGPITAAPSWANTAASRPSCRPPLLRHGRTSHASPAASCSGMRLDAIITAGSRPGCRPPLCHGGAPYEAPAAPSRDTRLGVTMTPASRASLLRCSATVSNVRERRLRTAAVALSVGAFLVRIPLEGPDGPSRLS